MKKLISLLLVLLVACDKPAPEQFALTSDGVKSLSPSIESVNFTSQADPSKFLVDIKIKNDPDSDGAQNWNSVAGEVHRLSRSLFAKPEVVRARISFVPKNDSRYEWAIIFIDAKKLPKSWSDLSYLRFFSQLQIMPGTLQSSGWLCEFYKKYNSATPDGVVPESCANWPKEKNN